MMTSCRTAFVVLLVSAASVAVGAPRSGRIESVRADGGTIEVRGRVSPSLSGKAEAWVGCSIYTDARTYDLPPVRVSDPFRAQFEYGQVHHGAKFDVALWDRTVVKPDSPYTVINGFEMDGWLDGKSGTIPGQRPAPLSSEQVDREIKGLFAQYRSILLYASEAALREQTPTDFERSIRGKVAQNVIWGTFGLILKCAKDLPEYARVFQKGFAVGRELTKEEELKVRDILMALGPIPGWGYVKAAVLHAEFKRAKQLVEQAYRQRFEDRHASLYQSIRQLPAGPEREKPLAVLEHIAQAYADHGLYMTLLSPRDEMPAIANTLDTSLEKWAANGCGWPADGYDRFVTDALRRRLDTLRADRDRITGGIWQLQDIEQRFLDLWSRMTGRPFTQMPAAARDAFRAELAAYLAGTAFRRELWRAVLADPPDDAKLGRLAEADQSGKLFTWEMDAVDKRLGEAAQLDLADWKRAAGNLHGGLHEYARRNVGTTPWDLDRRIEILAKLADGGADQVTLDLGNNVTLKLIRIKPGTFLMGSPADEEGRAKDEIQHEVTISEGFYIGIHEVKVGQFAAFVKDSGHKTEAEKEGWSRGWGDAGWGKVSGSSWRKPGFAQTDDHPVACVSWNDAKAFCDWLSRRAQRTVRLPTEAEWEYACRAGNKARFSFGDASMRDHVWCRDNSEDTSHPAGQKRPNAWGLYDMHGNVWEWCSDWYGEYPRGAVRDPAGLAHGESRMLRGGSWNNVEPHVFRSAYRNREAPDNRAIDIGFRICLDFP
jgi:formylglycine-generating enzyme required for sulfatase activity